MTRHVIPNVPPARCPRTQIQRWVLLALALTAAGCASSTTTRPRVAPSPRPDRAASARVLRVEVVDAGQTRVLILPLEDYVTGSVLAEVALGALPPAAVLQVARLQAVLARTYAVANRGRHAHEGFDLCADTHCQLYRAPGQFAAQFQSVATAAAADTRDLVLAYEGRPIQALFHSDCGGHTSDAGVVWGGPTPPYLLAVPDALVTETHRAWRFEAAVDQVLAALNDDVRTRVGARLNRIDVVERDVAGRAVRAVIDGESARMVRGEELRAVLTAAFGARTIRSTRFEVERTGETLVFTGSGFGHGVGLCQVGAIARAAQGRPFHQILQHYYSGVRLEPLSAIRVTAIPPGDPRENATPTGALAHSPRRRSIRLTR